MCNTISQQTQDPKKSRLADGTEFELFLGDASTLKQQQPQHQQKIQQQQLQQEINRSLTVQESLSCLVNQHHQDVFVGNVVTDQPSFQQLLQQLHTSQPLVPCQNNFQLCVANSAARLEIPMPFQQQ
jgi:hypothetical protein